MYTLYQYNQSNNHHHLHKQNTQQWIENLFLWLFVPQEQGTTFSKFKEQQINLQNQLQQFLAQLSVVTAMPIAQQFFDTLPNIHQQLQLDLQAILAFDPAAKSRTEVLLAYPGFFTIVVHRIAHQLHQYQIPVLPRVLSEYAHSKTGIDIHPGATIGDSFFIDHGTGIVIGETATIGKNVKIYQGVTLGALSVSKDKAQTKRHPTIQDNVIIYANATILGGQTTIGQGSVIGGNVWITQSIPAESLVYHKNEIIVKTKIDYNNVIDFSI